jgi:RHS repeat-associated protein
LDQLAKTVGWADGTQTTVARDAAGRVVQVTSPWWQTTMTYVPGTGQVASVARGTQAIAWAYDGALPTRETITGLVPAVVQWAYDSNFRVTSQTVGGVAVPSAYDDDGLPVKVGDAVLARNPTTGQVQTETVGSLATAYSYNGYGEVASLATTRNGAPVYSEALSYDGAGRVVAIDESAGATTVHWVYGYDSQGRLTSATKDGAAAGNWAYSGNGNRVVDGTRSATFDAQDRLLTHGARSFTHDAMGGRTSMTDGAQVTAYVHDGLGALLSVGLPGGVTVSYEYDGLQRRVAKRRNGEVVKRWVYEGQTRVVAEVDSSGAVTSRFVYLPGAYSPEYLVRGGVTYRYVSNSLGSVRLVVNASTGEVVQRLDYDAWGNISSDSSPGFQPFAFAGGVYDSDTGLTHFGFRDYDAATGTWTGKDPIRLAWLSPDLMAQSPYAYARNNPLRFVDSDGLRPGDRFSGANGKNRAAADVLDFINPTSKRTDEEYAGQICRDIETWEYFATDPVTQHLRDSSNPMDSPCPRGSATVAIYHTHGADKPGYKSNEFSPQDIWVDDLMHWDGYLGTPSNGYWKHYHNSGRAPIQLVPAP